MIYKANALIFIAKISLLADVKTEVVISRFYELLKNIDECPRSISERGLKSILFASTESFVHQYKPCTKQRAAYNIGDPMHTRDESAYYHKSGKSYNGYDSAPSDYSISDTYVQLQCRRRHQAHNEHRC